MKISIVLGLGFGDEGKGATVNASCTDPKNTIVIRFNGGHQCGHTVVHNGIRHPFSNFGSGTLKGVPTYWSEYCTVNPSAVKKEGDVLRAQGISPIVYYNANAMVTTPFDIYRNMNDKTNKLHGTVGVGFGATIKRNNSRYHLYVRDLLYPKIRDVKLTAIRKYICDETNDAGIYSERMDKIIEEFKLACDELVQRFEVVDNFDNLRSYDCDLIFEGGQGIMLDMDYGFYPNVTWSNTTSKNAVELITKWGMTNRLIETYYITRAYQTRHGNGPMTNDGLDISYIKPNPLETNVNTGAQGVFRKSVLDLELLNYALSCDAYHRIVETRRFLVITCMDQVGDRIPVTTYEGKLLSLTPKEIGNWLTLFNIYTSNSDQGIVF
jgi:adenylosuccinate synthase